MDDTDNFDTVEVFKVNLSRAQASVAECVTSSRALADLCDEIASTAEDDAT